MLWCGSVSRELKSGTMCCVGTIRAFLWLHNREHVLLSRSDAKRGHHIQVGIYTSCVSCTLQNGSYLLAFTKLLDAGTLVTPAQ